jgi:hypothetical protein
MTLEELQTRIAEFRKDWCGSQKNDQDILMFSHMCYVLDVYPSLQLTPKDITEALNEPPKDKDDE